MGSGVTLSVSGEFQGAAAGETELSSGFREIVQDSGKPVSSSCTGQTTVWQEGILKWPLVNFILWWKYNGSRRIFQCLRKEWCFLSEWDSVPSPGKMEPNFLIPLHNP